MIIMRGDENPQRPLESDPGSPRRSTGNGKFREFLEGGGKFGGDWKRVLCAGMGARNERKLQCGDFAKAAAAGDRSEEHTSELQSRLHLVCRLLLEKKKQRSRNDRHMPRTVCTSRS